MKTNFDNLFLALFALTETGSVSSAVVVRRRRPVKTMEFFG